jgi:hypothetical protein
MSEESKHEESKPEIPIGKVYIQGSIKRSETEFYTLLPTLLSLGFNKDTIICNPHLEKDKIPCESIFNIYDPFLQRGPIPPFTPNASHLPLDEVIKMLNFASSVQNAASLPLPDSTPILLLDATIIARHDFLARLKEFLESSKTTDWECVSLAHTPSTVPPEADASYFSSPQIYEQEPMSVVNSGALLLRLSFIRKIVKTILPFRDPVDYELIFQTLLHKTKAYYMYPPILEYR